MLPTYAPGDHVLTFSWIRPEVGDVVVFAHGGKRFLKRISKINGELIYVCGDNKSKSSKLGAIKESQVIGRVVLKY